MFFAVGLRFSDSVVLCRVWMALSPPQCASAASVTYWVFQEQASRAPHGVFLFPKTGIRAMSVFRLEHNVLCASAKHDFRRSLLCSRCSQRSKREILVFLFSNWHQVGWRLPSACFPPTPQSVQSSTTMYSLSARVELSATVKLCWAFGENNGAENDHFARCCRHPCDDRGLDHLGVSGDHHLEGQDPCRALGGSSLGFAHL